MPAQTLFQASEAEWVAAVAAVLWPFLRIGAMLLAMPLFGSANLPVRVRVLLAFALALFVAPLLPPPPAIDPISGLGLLTAVQQVLIGAAMGFILQMAISALAQAGEAIALSMGLGFANMVDPGTGMQTPVISQFLILLGTLIFLASGAHILALEVLLDSFLSLPIGVLGIVREDFWRIASWGLRMYAGALLIALPIIGSLLLVNIAFGVITRFAPQLNIFAIGFPITMLLGMAIMVLTLPTVAPKFTLLLMDAFDLIGSLTRGP